MAELSPDSSTPRLFDSAGVPWAGRHFEANPWQNDAGTADPMVAATISRVIQRHDTVEKLMAVLPGTRLLVPLLAELGDSEIGPHGQKVDKSAELSMVAVATPDGASAIPAFTDVSSMQSWRRDARPVPVAVEKLALAAAGEGHTRVVINPATDTVGLRLPQLKALALAESWNNPIADPGLSNGLHRVFAGLSEVVSFELNWADPFGSLLVSEFEVTLWLTPGLNRQQLTETINRATELIAELPAASLMDSYSFKLLPANAAPHQG